MPARIRSNLFRFVSFNLQFRPFTFDTTQFTDRYWKTNFQKSRQPDFWRHMFTACWTCTFCFYVVVLLTSHSAQKFYLLIYVGLWLLLQLVAPKGAVFKDCWNQTVCRNQNLCHGEFSINDALEDHQPHRPPFKFRPKCGLSLDASVCPLLLVVPIYDGKLSFCYFLS